MRWTSPHGDRVFAHSTAPYIAVTIGRAAFTGFVNGTSVRVDLRDGASDAVLASGAASRGEDGSFAGEFRDANGHKFNVSVGDRVVADIATDVNFNVFAMDARADSTTDEITGHCPFDAYSEGALSGGFEFDIYRNGVWRDGGNDALADDGSFDYNVTFKSTDRILVGCQLTTGDFVQVWATMQ